MPIEQTSFPTICQLSRAHDKALTQTCKARCIKWAQRLSSSSKCKSSIISLSWAFKHPNKCSRTNKFKRGKAVSRTSEGRPSCSRQKIIKETYLSMATSWQVRITSLLNRYPQTWKMPSKTEGSFSRDKILRTSMIEILHNFPAWFNSNKISVVIHTKWRLQIIEIHGWPKKITFTLKMVEVQIRCASSPYQ